MKNWLDIFSNLDWDIFGQFLPYYGRSELMKELNIVEFTANINHTKGIWGMQVIIINCASNCCVSGLVNNIEANKAEIEMHLSDLLKIRGMQSIHVVVCDWKKWMSFFLESIDVARGGCLRLMNLNDAGLPGERAVAFVT